MIQKLRKKFVLVNMLLVSVVLLVVFGAVCFSSYHRLRRGRRRGKAGARGWGGF